MGAAELWSSRIVAQFAFYLSWRPLLASSGCVLVVLLCCCYCCCCSKSRFLCAKGKIFIFFSGLRQIRSRLLGKAGWLAS